MDAPLSSSSSSSPSISFDVLDRSSPQLPHVIKEPPRWNPPFYDDRLPSSHLLALETLHVQTTCVKTPLPLHLLNPSTAIFETLPPHAARGNIDLPWWEEKASWSRLTKLVLQDCTLRLGGWRGESEHLPLLCTSEEQIRELEIVFVSRALEHPSRRQFLEFIIRGLKELTLGRRAVKEVALRAARKRGGKNNVARYVRENLLGIETSDRLEKEGKLRFEVLEEE